MTSMRCGACSSAIRSGQRFCEACGQPLPRTCRACQAPVAADARFCGQCGAAQGGEIEPPAAAAALDAARASAPPQGERRQLTVMFADVAGATALSGQLDPEALRNLLRAFQRLCGDCVERYGGRIQQYLGDGVLAYFGYPAAHDNDAERAVLAALALVQATRRVGEVRAARGETPLQVRVGVHTGLVVVAAMGADAAPVDLAVGETPNLAARIQGEAAPDSVCISEATRGLLGRRFQVRPLEARALKGVSRALALFAVEGVSDAAPDWEVDRGAAPLVGRDLELQHLLQRWELAQGGRGQAVLVSGEAGIGKSRLLAALRTRIAPRNDMWRTVHCSPFHTSSALHPVVDLIERAIEAGRATDAAARDVVLQRQLRAAGIDDEISHALVASLLGLGAVPAVDAALGDLSPAQRRQRTMDVLIGWLQADAARQPLVMVFEDLHWIDPSSRELLGMLLERLADWPMLLVMTFRPDFVAPWPMRSPVSTIAMSRLAGADVASIMRGMTAGRDLPARVVDEIVRRTDGVPLFVEELTKAILAGGLVVEREGAWQVAAAAGEALAVPATLRDSLTSRLDRLGPAKAVAQLAAVIGREFDFALLRAVGDLPEAELEAQLAALNRADIVQQSGVGPQAQFRFRHALIQEAAYDTLLNSARRHHHRRVAEAYVARLPQLLRSRPELAAHHFARAAMPEEAVNHWREAGELALARSAHEEANAHLDAGLAQIECLPDSEARAAMELRLRVAVGPALLAALGFGAPAAGANYARACELAAALGESSDRFAALWGDWLFKNARGQLVAAAQRSEELVSLGRRLADDGYLLQAHHSRWTNHLFLGHVADARADTEQGLRLFDPARHRHHKYLYGGHDPCVCAHNFGSVAAGAMGDAAAARRLVDASLAMAREQGHVLTLGTALAFSAMVLHDQGDAVGTAAVADELVALCERHGFAQFTGIGRAARGAVQVARGDVDDGLAAAQAGIREHLARGPAGLSLPVFAMAAGAHLRAGQGARALALLEQAIELADRTQVGWWLPEIERLLADALLQSGRIAPELAATRQLAAAARARTQGAAALELRALTSCLRLGLARDDERALPARQRLQALSVALAGCGSADADAAQAFLDGTR